MVHVIAQVLYQTGKWGRVGWFGRKYSPSELSRNRLPSISVQTSMLTSSVDRDLSG